MSHLIIKLNKCRTIFFDLEFYVPKESRIKTGFCYNPWDKKCRLIGGSFLIANPVKDFNISEKNVRRKIQSLWLWNYNSERKLLEAIFSIFQKTHSLVSKAHDNKLSPILCGIGTTTSDIPIIFDLFRRYKILSNSESFSFQNKFRSIDLSQLSIATFNISNNFLYPKTKNIILNKYLSEKTFESGKIVWDLYEKNLFSEIENRVVDEVLSTHKCYELIKQDIAKFKNLELYDKKRRKLLAKSQ